MHAAWLDSRRVMQQSFVTLCWLLLQVPHQVHSACQWTLCLLGWWPHPKQLMWLCTYP